MFHWTPEGKRLFDFTSGVLVANLGHNPASWMKRFAAYMGWPASLAEGDYSESLPMTAYNAVTPLEVEATGRLIDLARRTPAGARLQRALWAASGSEAVHKALGAAAARDRDRSMIVATRYGFHGKKGLANAVTGSEADAERDPRVKFLSFPMAECDDLSKRGHRLDLDHFRKELDDLWHRYDRRLGALITEPYLGGGGSYHPQSEYLTLLQEFCRQRDVVFILDEVQSNFGRTGSMFAYETYGLEPDMVVLGKGLGNGVPVAAVLGPASIFDALDYGEASDTWSANPLSAAAVLATLDEFETRDILGPMQVSSALLEAELVALRQYPFIGRIRGERGGMVWGIEFDEHGGRPAPDWANAFVRECYRGEGTDAPGVHLLGPLAKKVIRIAPPLTISSAEVRDSAAILHGAAGRLRDCPELARAANV